MPKQAITNDAPPPRFMAPDERSLSSASPAVEPPPLSIRVEARRVEGLNKPAIVAAAGSVLAGILILAAMGLSAKPPAGPQARKELMGDPARRTLAEAQVGELPKTYADVNAFDPGGATSTVDGFGSSATAPPILGPPMAGDMAAFAPDGARSPIHGPDGFTDQGYAPGTSAPASAAYATPGGAATAGSAVASGPNEADIARRSGLFFKIAASGERTQMGRDAANAGASSPVRGPESLSALEASNPGPTQPSQGTAAAARRSIHPGTVIPASLLTAINSEAPGPVVAQVTSPVYDSETGDYVVIPQGARLIGSYKSTSRYGKRRIEIAWERLVTRDGREIPIIEPAVDATGAAGVAGRVDNHWGEVFAAVALGTAINVGAAATEDANVTVLSNLGNGRADRLERAVTDGVGRAASAATGRVVDRGLAIPPTIRIAAGARIAVLAKAHISVK